MQDSLIGEHGDRAANQALQITIPVDLRGKAALQP